MSAYHSLFKGCFWGDVRGLLKGYSISGSYLYLIVDFGWPLICFGCYFCGFVVFCLDIVIAVLLFWGVLFLLLFERVVLYVCSKASRKFNNKKKTKT